MGHTAKIMVAIFSWTWHLTTNHDRFVTQNTKSCSLLDIRALYPGNTIICSTVTCSRNKNNLFSVVGVFMPNFSTIRIKSIEHDSIYKWTEFGC